MDVTLKPDLEAFVRRKAASERDGDVDAVIADAIRLLLERDRASAAACAAPSTDRRVVQTVLQELEEPLRARGVASVALFGSILREEAGAGSDVDLLIDLDPAARFSLVDLVAVKNMLEYRLGREVDIATREGLDPAIRDAVLREAERVF